MHTHQQVTYQGTGLKESTPFQVIGVDYAGPIKYRTRGRKEGKPAYIIVLFACSEVVEAGGER